MDDKKPGELRLYNAENGQQYLTLRKAANQFLPWYEHVHGASILAAEFSPDGTQIVTGGMDGNIRIWDARAPGVGDMEADPPSEEDLPPPPMPNTAGGFTVFQQSGSVSDVGFRPGGRQFAVLNGAGTLRLHDSANGNPGTVIPFRVPGSWGMSFRPDGTEVAVVGYEGALAVTALDNRSRPRLLKDPAETKALYEVAYSPDGKVLATGGESTVVHLWDVAAWKRLRSLTGHTDEVWGLAFRPGGEQLASASKDKTVKIWDLETGREIRTLTGHTAEVADLAYSADGKRLASASWDKTLRLWDAETGKAIRTFEGHTGAVFKVKFSPDGHRLASGAADPSVRLWDVATGRLLATYTEHIGYVTSVAFSPDGTRLASSAADDTVEVRSIPPATP
jgi:WD40 repeat protein